LQVRDWLYVEDHVAGIDLVLHTGAPGEIYNLGGENERHNIDLVRQMLHLMNKPETLVRFVADRPGHDRRYALDNAKIRALGWRHSVTFDEALERTIHWYQRNEWWWRKIKSGEYRSYYEAQYGARLRN
jgi:dTDP-glucose 4,6-dehydratase